MRQLFTFPKGNLNHSQITHGIEESDLHARLAHTTTYLPDTWTPKTESWLLPPYVQELHDQKNRQTVGILTLQRNMMRTCCVYMFVVYVWQVYLFILFC